VGLIILPVYPYPLINEQNYLKISTSIVLSYSYVLFSYPVKETFHIHFNLLKYNFSYCFIEELFIFDKKIIQQIYEYYVLIFFISLKEAKYILFDVFKRVRLMINSSVRFNGLFVLVKSLLWFGS
jgi:hypothetical protein